MASDQNQNTILPAQSNHDQADAFVDAVSAAIPPSMQRHTQLSTDELLKEMNRVPLFMTSLDETDGEGGDNTLLEAIKALAYEGTKTEVAENFRQQGNEAARAKLWKDAREFYTKALQALSGQVETTKAPEDDPEIKVTEIVDEGEDETETEKSKQREKEIEEACLANRALCNLEMKNYNLTTRDAAATLSLNPHNIKAWYRAALACLLLDKIPEALDACTSGLRFDPSNTPLVALKAKVEKRGDILASLEQARRTREEKVRQEGATLRSALKQRSILTRETAEPPDMEDAAISLSDAASPDSTLSFPVILLYPLHAQTDLIKSYLETDSLTHHLEYILPLPWDSGAEYSKPDDVECYMETLSGGLIKAGKKLTLVKLLGSGKVEIVDGLVRIYVVPKARASEWIEQFKIRRGKQ